MLGLADWDVRLAKLTYHLKALLPHLWRDCCIRSVESCFISGNALKSVVGANLPVSHTILATRVDISYLGIPFLCESFLFRLVVQRHLWLFGTNLEMSGFHVAHLFQSHLSSKVLAGLCIRFLSLVEHDFTLFKCSQLHCFLRG